MMRGESVQVGALGLPGVLSWAPAACGLVLFAHGSGSSRLSPRNRVVASVLNERGLATLLFDLLDEAEAGDRAKVFDIELLADRLGMAADWAAGRPELAALSMGLFGASTGAAAALTLAARRPHRIGAVVSRGGRPDLCREPFAVVRAPTLLLVGGLDEQVLALNRQTFAQLGGEKRLEVVPGAAHLFEEPGALDTVAAHAADWFARHLCGEAGHD